MIDLALRVCFSIVFCILFFLAPSQVAAQSEAVVGRWVLDYYEPGVVEPKSVEMVVSADDGNQVTALIEIGGAKYPFQGTFDEGTGTLAVSIEVDGNSGRIELVRDEQGRFNGDADVGGNHLVIYGRRTDEPLPERKPVDLSVERPINLTYDKLETSVKDQAQAKILEVMNDSQAVGMSVAFIEDNQITDVLNIGWEDYEMKIEASEKTMYRWASIAKTMTAIAAVQVAHSGHLDLDADVRTIVPEYDKDVAMTSLQLIRHEAGVPHYGDLKIRTLKEYDVAHPWADPIIALDMFNESALVRQPGEAQIYSTPGYVLLGAVLHRTAPAGSYVNHILEEIASPLGMTSLRPDYIWEEIPHRAAAYERFKETVNVPNMDDISWKLAAGGWISTIEDLARFVAGVMGNKLLTPEQKEMMWGPIPDEDQGRYQMGVIVRDVAGRRMLTHSGGQTGTSTYFRCNPATGNAVVMMCNTEGLQGMTQLSLDLLDLIDN